MRRLFQSEASYVQGAVFRDFGSPSFACLAAPAPPEVSQPGCSSFPVTDNNFGALPSAYAKDAVIDEYGYDERWASVTGPLDPEYANLWAQLSAPHQGDVLQNGCFCIGEGVNRPTLGLGAPRFPRISPLAFFWVPRAVNQFINVVTGGDLEIPFWGNESGGNVNIFGGEINNCEDNDSLADTFYDLGTPGDVWVSIAINIDGSGFTPTWEFGTYPGYIVRTSAAVITYNIIIGTIAGGNWEQKYGGGHINLGCVPSPLLPFEGYANEGGLKVTGGSVYGYYSAQTLADTTYAAAVSRDVWVEVTVDKTNGTWAAAYNDGTYPGYKSSDTSTEIVLNYLLGTYDGAVWEQRWGRGDIYIPGVLHGVTATIDIDTSMAYNDPNFNEYYYADVSFLNGIPINEAVDFASPSSRTVFTASACTSS